MGFFKQNIYGKNWFNQLDRQLDFCRKAKKNSNDPCNIEQPVYTTSVVQRIAALLKDPGLIELVGSCLPQGDRVCLVKDVIGKLDLYYAQDSQEMKLEKILRVTLALLTEGVVTAPLDGLAHVEVIENFIKLTFAGPIRAAGGTICGMILLIAQYLRTYYYPYAAYKPTEDQITRNVAQILAYVRKKPTQIRPSKEQIEFVVRNCPIMIDGTEDQLQVVPVYKYLPRINKPRIRGSVALVIIEGVIIRAAKIYKMAQSLGLNLSWLKDLTLLSKRYRKSEGSRIAEASSKYSLSIGRPVISESKSFTGLRLRIGSTPTLGLSACNVHPLLLDLLGFLNIGSQLIISYPGKAATITGTCEDLEPPKVRYQDGIKVYERGTQDMVVQIVQLGQIMVALGEFLEGQKTIPVRDYCRGLWRRDTRYTVNVQDLDQVQALNLYETYPYARLCPKYGLNLQALSFKEYCTLREAKNLLQVYPLVKKLGLEHELVKDSQGLLLVPKYPLILQHYLARGLEVSYEDYTGHLQEERSGLTSYLNQVLLRANRIRVPEKGFYCIYARVGRAEAINIAKIRPRYTYSLAQYSYKNPLESFWSAVDKQPYSLNRYYLRRCYLCNQNSAYRLCRFCGLETVPTVRCLDCEVYEKKEEFKFGVDHKEHKITDTFLVKRNYLRELELITDLGLSTGSTTEIKRNIPLKLRNSKNAVRYPEPLIKGYMRSKNHLSVTKDGTIRYSHPNLITTHFKPRQIGVTLDVLKELGYETDYLGKPLEDVDQILTLKYTDIIISETLIPHLWHTADYLDDLLEYYYKKQRFYNVKSAQDLLGLSFFTLSPHTSLATLGRIIGFTKNLGIYYHPVVVAARRRDVDGDMDSGNLLLDLFLNMSTSYLDHQKTGAYMGVALTMTSQYTLDSVGKQVLSRQTCSNYYEQLDLVNTKEHKIEDLTGVINVNSHLVKGINNLDPNFGFNTPSFCINSGNTVNLYRDLDSNEEKVNLVLELENKLTGVDQSQCIIGLLEGHLIPDIIGNFNAFFRQKIKCGFCAQVYENIPLSERCVRCGVGTLKPTVYQKMVTKYYKILLKIESLGSLPAYLVEKIGYLKSTLTGFTQGKKNKLRDLF